MSWQVVIGQTGADPQERVSNITVTEEFGMVNFSVTITSPTLAERNHFKGRKDEAIIQISRGSEVVAEGFIEDVEYGSGYVTYTGRSFLILLGYSTSSETSSGGVTDAEYENDIGQVIIEDLINKYCTVKDNEIVRNITFPDKYGGFVKLHGKKVYQIVEEMCQMYGYDLWSTTTWVGNNITEKIINVGMRERGDDVTPHMTLYGGRHFRDIPIVRNRSSQAINCLRVIGGGTGKDKVSEFIEDGTAAPDNSIENYGYIEGEPYHNNMIRSVETAQSVGQAIINAKKDPIEQIKTDLIIYMADLEYGDWIRVVDTHTGLDVIRRIKKIVRIYDHKSIDRMQIELGNAFDNYQNIINNLTKGDVDPEPDMSAAGGSLRVTANDPPDTYVRIDNGDWYGTDGILYRLEKSTIRTFWEGDPAGTLPFNARGVDKYFKALIQIKDGATSFTDITYKTSITSQSVGTGYNIGDAINESILPDTGYMPVCELILKCKETSGTIYDITALNEGGSYIYRDARPIVGNVSGLGGSCWDLNVDNTASPKSIVTKIDMIGKSITTTGGTNMIFEVGIGNSFIFRKV